MQTIAVSGSFDDLRSGDVRFLEEAARRGAVHVYLWTDRAVRAATGADPVFPLQERKYFLEAVRFVHKVLVVETSSGMLPLTGDWKPACWIVRENEDTSERLQFCRSHGIDYQVLRADSLQGFPAAGADSLPAASNKKVLVTGCYDWLHSGHVRFFEEASALGDLVVVVGHDENVRLLKGSGHPLFPQEERRYMVGAIRYVRQALVSTGSGWMDAEPEIEALRPEVYVVNDDGDKPEKREFCARHGLEYVVLKRLPAAGLPRRESTHLRGF